MRSAKQQQQQQQQQHTIAEGLTRQDVEAHSVSTLDGSSSATDTDGFSESDSESDHRVGGTSPADSASVANGSIPASLIDEAMLTIQQRIDNGAHTLQIYSAYRRTHSM